MNNILVLLLLSLPAAASKGSHSLWVLATSIKGQTPFPEFSGNLMLDDVRLVYYNGDTSTYIRRGNTTNEDAVLDSNVIFSMSDSMKRSFIMKWSWILSTDNLDKTDSILVLQRLVMCDLKDNGEPGQMITRDAFQGSTIDELRYIDKNFTYEGKLNVTAERLKVHLDITMRRHENHYYPLCIKTLKGYLEKRRNQVNRKVKPKVRLFQTELSYGSRVSCLATGFYPRHINLTLFRDGQPVADHEVTGGNLLPNDDGTYQMRKILEISAEEQREKHTYTCTATHLSLDNKLDVELDGHLDKTNYSYYIIGAVIGAFVLLLVILAIWLKKRQDINYDFAAAAEENDEDAEL